MNSCNRILSGSGLLSRKVHFKSLKICLVSHNLLINFDSSLPFLLACDASQYGIGVVLAHRMPNGSERLIGYASRTLIYQPRKTTLS